MEYRKPPLTLDEQLHLLTSRGLDIPDTERALRYLSHISYFRFSGYWIPFEQTDTNGEHRFLPNTTFDNVLDLYIFDRKFRLLMLEAIERVEVSFRAHFANELGVKHGSHFYLDSSYFNRKDLHKNFLTSLENEIRRSTETFISHYCRTYDTPPLPPIWAISEIMSFGQLSKCFRNLKTRKDRRSIANHYQIDESILRSFMHHLTHIRNIVAHHGRLWNRKLTITMTLPNHPSSLANMLNPAAERKIGNTVIVLGWLLKQISPGTTWPLRIYDLIESFPIAPTAMGFDENYKDITLFKEVTTG